MRFRGRVPFLWLVAAAAACSLASDGLWLARGPLVLRACCNLAVVVLWVTAAVVACRRWRGRQRELLAGEPSGVRIVHADGSVSECALIRDPQDRDGLAQWIAEPPPGAVFTPGADRVVVDCLPPRTAVSLAVRPGPSFTCPRCGRTSWNPRDRAEGYCGACHDWTGEPAA